MKMIFQTDQNENFKKNLFFWGVYGGSGVVEGWVTLAVPGACFWQIQGTIWDVESELDVCMANTKPASRPAFKVSFFHVTFHKLIPRSTKYLLLIYHQLGFLGIGSPYQPASSQLILSYFPTAFHIHFLVLFLNLGLGRIWRSNSNAS